jgi:hypothetical protein
MNRPFQEPLILIWGPDEKNEAEYAGIPIGGKRRKLKDAAVASCSECGVEARVAFSEDLWAETRKVLSYRIPSDAIGYTEAPHVDWADLLICLDVPYVDLTLRDELHGLVLPKLEPYAPNRPRRLRRVVIFEEAGFYEAMKAFAEGREAPGWRVKSGSVARSTLLVKRVLELSRQLAEEEGELDLLAVRPYTEQQFRECSVARMAGEETERLLISLQM